MPGLYYDKNLSTLFNLQKDYNKNWRLLCPGLIRIGYQNHCVMVSGLNMVFLSRWEMNG